jgi:glycerol-3-phosphate dehydrogenase (NAD(P)+)
MTSVSVFGGGAWGTALALICHRAGNATTLWVRDPEQAQAIQELNQNKKYLPGVILPKDIKITSSLDKAAQASIILLAIPAQILRLLLEDIRPYLLERTHLIICSKGIEMSTSKLLNEVVAETLPGYSTSVLSGPNLAQEIAQEKPAAAALATSDLEIAYQLAYTLSSSLFRIYPTQDRVGVALGGALKNVISIAAGIIVARNLGENARAALITRGLAEITRLGLKMGAHLETFMGLAGIGDIALSCMSSQSRNMAFGLEIGKHDLFLPKGHDNSILTEGVFTAKAAYYLARSKGIELPITASIYRIVYQGSSINEEIKTLLSRPLKGEPFEN